MSFAGYGANALALCGAVAQGGSAEEATTALQESGTPCMRRGVSAHSGATLLVALRDEVDFDILSLRTSPQ